MSRHGDPAGKSRHLPAVRNTRDSDEKDPTGVGSFRVTGPEGWAGVFPCRYRYSAFTPLQLAASTATGPSPNSMVMLSAPTFQGVMMAK